MKDRDEGDGMYHKINKKTMVNERRRHGESLKLEMRKRWFRKHHTMNHTLLTILKKFEPLVDIMVNNV